MAAERLFRGESRNDAVQAGERFWTGLKESPVDSVLLSPCHPSSQPPSLYLLPFPLIAHSGTRDYFNFTQSATFISTRGARRYDETKDSQVFFQVVF